MARSITPRNFQWATVRAVCEGLDASNGIYALADEVGLGKTLVCAETAYQLIMQKGRSKRERNIVYYIAPSIELLHQNLQSIRNYLTERAGTGFQVLASVSRLSRIPLDLAERGGTTAGEGSKPTIHVIGLSPGT